MYSKDSFVGVRYTVDMHQKNLFCITGGIPFINVIKMRARQVTAYISVPSLYRILKYPKQSFFVSSNFFKNFFRITIAI